MTKSRYVPLFVLACATAAFAGVEPRLSCELGLHSLGSTGAVKPAFLDDDPDMALGIEFGLGFAGEWLRPMVSVRNLVPVTSQWAVEMAGERAAEIRVYEVAVVASLTAALAAGKKAFVRGDVYPYLAVPTGGVDRYDANYRYEASARNPLGFGIRGSAGFVFRPVVLGLSAEFDTWASTVSVAQYHRTMQSTWTKTQEASAEFSTSVLRFGVYLGLRFGG